MLWTYSERYLIVHLQLYGYLDELYYELNYGNYCVYKVQRTVLEFQPIVCILEYTFESLLWGFMF